MKNTGKRPFAVFDIDGTLIRWQLFHAIVDELGRQGHVPATAYERVRTARMAWKQRSQKTSFGEYEQVLVDAYMETVTGLQVSTFMKAVQHVFDEYKDQVYAYTRDLIRELKAKDYILFAISGSQTEVVKLLADYYGFDASAGSHYEQKGGIFTGGRSVLRQQAKITALEDMMQRFNASSVDSIAVGDSEGDIPLLEHVETAIAFNPTKLLFDHAQKNGWKVVVERKNMIYRLEPHDGSYLLA